jgi:DNA-binding MarR family transcriptional regulator
MFDEELKKTYDAFKELLYASLCQQDDLTVLESFSLDVIYSLHEPTIVEYARYMKISQPNATYKINQLIDKGYLVKVQDENDGRVYHLRVTDKFHKLYTNDKHLQVAISAVKKNFTPKQLELLEKMLITMQEGLKSK